MIYLKFKKKEKSKNTKGQLTTVTKSLYQL